MNSSIVKRAYKFRFYPTDEQAETLARTFGCVRVVWNNILAERTRRYRIENASTSYADSDRMLTEFKKNPEFSWLNEVSSVPLQQTLRHQHTALQSFFEKRAKYPNFKSRAKSRASATYTRSGFTYRAGQIKLAKTKTPLDIVWSRNLPEGAIPTTVTVSRDKSDRWFVSMLVEEEIAHLPASNKSIGVDLGVKAAIVTSDGDAFNPDLKREQRKVKHAQRAFSRTTKGSNRREKARLKLAKRHAKVADKRKDFLHKASTTIIRENQTVVVEDLAVKAMTASARGTVARPGKNVRQKAGLNRGILNHSFGEFRSMLEYKAGWYGREIVVADRFYPSSKTCSNCGHLLSKLSLSVRTWKCPSCGIMHDRDINAAQNLVAFALGHREKQNARGGPVAKLSSESIGRLNEPRTNPAVMSGIPRL